MLFALLFTLALGALKTQPEFSRLPLDEVVSWEQWKEHFGKTYTERLEEIHRKKIFLDNVNTILKHNAEGHNWRMGVNQFSDLTGDEWQNKYTNNTFKHTPHPNGPTVLPETPLTSVDWRSKGAITPVKNQEQCGSCWAFSTTGSTEAAWFLKHGELVSLSEEQLVQCDRAHDQGCQGGLMDYAFQYIEGAGGITDEDDYPYTSGSGVRGRCKNPIPAFKATVSGFHDVTPDNALQLQAALAKTAVSIAVEADKSAWQHYSSGVMDSESCGTQLDHGVLAVGFDTEGGYWIVKNSWGTTWGEEGYIRLGMSSSSRHGICGLLQQPSYPDAGDAPGPGPSPGPTPSPGPAGDHYEDPAAGGCGDDEEAVQIQGIDGDFCSPKCSGMTCPDAPSDVASGVQAQCALQTTTGDKYCALICTPSMFSHPPCGPENMTCKRAALGVGICTYDD